MKTKIRILFFIGSLRSGGKERRMIELLTYLKAQDKYEMMVVVTEDEIHYPAFKALNIEYRVIHKKWKKQDPTVVYKLFKICKSYQPDIIHSWGKMQAFYLIPTVMFLKIPLVNSQIASAPPPHSNFKPDNIDRLNFKFSTAILSNSKAGIDAFRPPANKSQVIYNGLNINRFQNLENPDVVKAKYKIATPYAVVMAASFSPNKDYRKFINIAKIVTAKRKDITFIGVGSYEKFEKQFGMMQEEIAGNTQILLPGRITDVEALTNAADVGVLFSNKDHGEGLSNSILEYMSLARPVIATNCGGTQELISNGVNGCLISDEDDTSVAQMIIDLIDDPRKRNFFGEVSRKKIMDHFTLQRMGSDFEKLYINVLKVSPAADHNI